MATWFLDAPLVKLPSWNYNGPLIYLLSNLKVEGHSVIHLDHPINQVVMLTKVNFRLHSFYLWFFQIKHISIRGCQKSPEVRRYIIGLTTKLLIIIIDALIFHLYPNGIFFATDGTLLLVCLRTKCIFKFAPVLTYGYVLYHVHLLIVSICGCCVD